MLVRELMTSPAVTVAPDAGIKEAAGLLTDHAITAMPVVDDSGALVGVVSEADLLGGAVLPDPRAHERPVTVPLGSVGARVADVMTHFPLSVRPDADLAAAVELMSGTVVKSLPVVDHGRVVGVVSRRDVVAVLARDDRRIEAEVDELLRSAGFECVVDVQEGVVSLSAPSDPHAQETVRVLAATVQGVLGVRFVG
jgi:CBS domain-containing protein